MFWSLGVSKDRRVPTMVIRERQITKACPVRGGYSLMELMVVVAIIVVLAGIGGYYFLGRLGETQEDADLAQTKVLTEACTNYRIDKGTWPTSLQELTQLRPGGNAPYLENEAALQPKSVPNGQYNYDASGQHNNGLKPDIWVDGPHGQIGNWMPKLQR
jgi:general secretion pathway protein G